jgi:hypothetical protein
MMECNKCGSRIGEFYKYENEIYCFDCLLKELNIEEEIFTYYKINGENVANENDIGDYIESLGIYEVEV